MTHITPSEATVVRRVPCKVPDGGDPEQQLTREWLVTNGLGGYASGTIAGVATRRYHGLLIAALPAPHGRTLLLSHLTERLRMADGTTIDLWGEERASRNLNLYGASYLEEFRLEDGLPVWRYRIGRATLEKRVLMPHKQNSVYITYTLENSAGPVRLKLQPMLQFRGHDAPVDSPLSQHVSLSASGDRYEFAPGSDLPRLRMRLYGQQMAFTFEAKTVMEALYRIEEQRGYESAGQLWSPGYLRSTLEESSSVTFVASTEDWDTVEALRPEDAADSEHNRRRQLIARAPAPAREGTAAELVLAADQFLVKPAVRAADSAWANAGGDEVRTVIAGYHWFTDWGRDTMISLEGLTLSTGRHAEAGFILRTFGRYLRDGLLPNLFPEGGREGLYHTADATLWFFHAIDRYLTVTDDWPTVMTLLPKLREVAEFHQRGTRFGIGVDPADSLLRQGEEGLQLTWMDAKVDDWVVTPRRGKAVEINALWYNALRLLEEWLTRNGQTGEAAAIAEAAGKTRRSFNQRFWNADEGCLFDVVDGEEGDDPACRPNQLFAISLKYPVLDQEYWRRVLKAAENRLLTPVGLRSLAPGHPDYKPQYYGDLRSRDAAYHQGTVWGWLIGPFIDVWLKVHPGDHETARAFLEGFEDHLSEACIGQISEVFDAEAPCTPRGCIAQAWSVAEMLRCWILTAEPDADVPEK